jgi:hypothetical protein
MKRLEKTIVKLFFKISNFFQVYTENDSKVGNLARRLRKFFVWSKRPLCKLHKRERRRKICCIANEAKFPTFESFSVYLLAPGFAHRQNSISICDFISADWY